MISNDFEIDLKKKEIRRKDGAKTKVYTVKELYSFLQNVFDEPEMMRYEIPIMATGTGNFSLINGWAITDDCYKFLKGELSEN